MKTSLYRLTENNWIKQPISQKVNDAEAQLVLCFASKSVLQSNTIYSTVKNKFPSAEIVMASTAGEICQTEVLDNSLIAVAIQFKKVKIKATSVNIKDYKNSNDAAKNLAKNLKAKDLVYVLVISDGSLVNGSELVKGLSTQVEKNVLITGGLAGDGAQFSSTLTGLNKQPAEGEIIAVGFYGNSLKVTHGSQGGWDIFGLEKTVTKSNANILFELDGQNALELYKKYLGEQAKNLPGAALLFPLSVTIPGVKKPVVRTILSINEEDKSMTFAGDLPEGSKVKFMKADLERITMAAYNAAKYTEEEYKKHPDFSLLISCVGRKLILGESTAEEVKAVSAAFYNKTVLAGFYSYGEITPFNEGGFCQLHNQTMTITSFFEAE